MTLAYSNGAFDFDLDFEQAVSRTYNLELDVDALNLQQWLGFDPGQFLDVSLTADAQCRGQRRPASGIWL